MMAPNATELFLQNAVPTDVVDACLRDGWTHDAIFNLLSCERHRISRDYVAKLSKEFLDRADLVDNSDALKEMLLDTLSSSIHGALNDDDRGFCWVSYSSVWTRVLNPYWDSAITQGHAQLGLQIWEAEICCLEFLEENQDIIRARNVLEIGSGPGLAGLSAGQRFEASQVLLTDFSCEVLDNLRKIVNTSPVKHQIKVAPLDWHSEEQVKTIRGYDFIIAADCIYDPNDIPNFVKTLEILVANSPDAQILLASSVRNKHTFDKLVKYLSGSSLCLDVIPTPNTGRYSQNVTHMFTKKWTHESVVLTLLRTNRRSPILGIASITE